MRFHVVTAEQRSPEWFAARLGCLTASCASAVADGFRKDKKPTAERRDLLTRLVVERLTGRSADDPYLSGDMTRGIELEPQARIAYEFATGVSVQQVGFLRHAELMAGASPDGVIGDFAGLVEIKCPRSARHLEYLRESGIPSDYRPQLLHQLWISGAGYVDFVSFDPAMPERLQTFITRLTRDEKEIAEYEQKALAFLAEVDRDVSALMTMADPVAVMAAVVEA